MVLSDCKMLSGFSYSINWEVFFLDDFLNNVHQFFDLFTTSFNLERLDHPSTPGLYFFSHSLNYLPLR